MTAGIQYFDFSVGPTQTREIPSEGSYLRYYSGSAGGLDESILVKSDTGGLVCILKPGQAIKLNDIVRCWRISNYKQLATITGIVVIGNGELSDSNITSTVQAANGELNNVNAGKCFVAQVPVFANAGNLSIAQLWNPAGSGLSLVLNKILFYTATGPTAPGLLSHNAALTTLFGNGKNKKLGSPDSQAQIRTQYSAAQIGTPLIYSGLVASGEATELVLSEPLIIPPGYGANAALTTVNVTINASFQWSEIVL